MHYFRYDVLYQAVLKGLHLLFLQVYFRDSMKSQFM